jgi:hypothetical protein
MTYHDFTAYSLGIPVGYAGNGFDTDWEITDVASIGRRLLVPNHPSTTWLQIDPEIITSAVIEFEAPDNDSFANIEVGIYANGVNLCSFTHSDLTLKCATYGQFVVIDPIPLRLRLEVEVTGTEDAAVTATLRDADTNTILGTCSDSMFGTLTASSFGMFVYGYPALITASIKKFGWQVASSLVLSEFSDVLVVQLEDTESPRLREYETQLPEEAPPRLQDFYSQRLLAVLGAVKDDAIDDSLNAIAETYASTASEKRLLEIGADRLIDRYPTESLTSYREAVLNASSILEWRGTAKGIQDEIARFGYIATYIPLRNANPTHWAEFILILRNGRIQRTLGTGGPWDIGMSLLERNALLKLVRRWKNSDERLAMISYAVENNDFWGESGTWGDNTTWVSGGTKVIYARPYAWGDNPNDTWNSSQGTWGDTDTYPVQEG